MIVGWSMQPHMRASLMSDALRMAWFRRQPPPGLIVHTDRGSQYCCDEFQKGADRVRDAHVDEPQGRLLGQRAHRKPVEASECRQTARTQIRHQTGRLWTR